MAVNMLRAKNFINLITTKTYDKLSTNFNCYWFLNIIKVFWIFSRSQHMRFFLVKLTWSPLSRPGWNKKETERKQISKKR